MNSLECLQLPWFVAETVVVAEKRFSLSLNRPSDTEYYFASKYGHTKCLEGKIYEIGTKIVIHDVDNIYRFPDFGLTYKTSIDGTLIDIIADDYGWHQDFAKNLRRNIDESECSI